MKLDRKWFAMGFLAGLLFTAYAYAATVDQILNAVYVSGSAAIRISPV